MQRYPLPSPNPLWPPVARAWSQGSVHVRLGVLRCCAEAAVCSLHRQVNHHPSDRLLDLTAASLEGGTQSFDPETLATVASAFAQLRPEASRVFELIESNILARPGGGLSVLSNRGLVNLLHAYAQAGQQAPGLFAASSPPMATRARNLHPAALAKVLWSYSKLGAFPHAATRPQPPAMKLTNLLPLSPPPATPCRPQGTQALWCVRTPRDCCRAPHACVGDRVHGAGIWQVPGSRRCRYAPGS